LISGSRGLDCSTFCSTFGSGFGVSTGMGLIVAQPIKNSKKTGSINNLNLVNDIKNTS
jgi:hypothetical protein